MSKNINVIGLGYIGLPTALILAAHGLDVTGTDYNESLINNLNKKVLSFKEDGLTEMFELALKNHIKFSTKYIKADFYIIAVPTPYDKLTKKIEISFVVNAFEEVIKVCGIGAIVIIESTITPGTIDNILKPLAKNKGLILGTDIHFVHAPERIIPGNMIFELVNNSRTIGADSSDIGEIVKEIYSSFCKSQIIITDIKTAEMSKVVENTYRDVNIAFANELAKICNEGNMDVYEIIKVANMHPRVNILQPGPGVGGHCISVDPWFLVGEYPSLTKLIHNARLINDSMPIFVHQRIKSIMDECNIQDYAKVGLYGMTYKENVDDTRESPTLQLISYLDEKNIHGYRVYDPFISEILFKDQFLSFNDFIEGLELIVIMVAHNQIKENYELIKKLEIFDTRNIFKSNNIYKL